MATKFQVVIDCADADRMATYWAEALHYVVQPPPEGYDTWPEFLVAAGIPASAWDARSAVVDPDGVGPRVFFQQVPEGKTVKNRMHLDLNVSGGYAVPLPERHERIRAEAKRLVAAGAEIVGEVDEGPDFHVQMLDPEGNEFCVQ
jgi:hypothetical protein